MTDRQTLQAHQLDLDGSARQAVAAMESAAAAWGAEWRSQEGGGSLLLPVNSGLRRGLLRLEVQINEAEGGTGVTLVPIDSDIRLNLGATGVLAFGAFGGIIAMLWPFFPQLLRLAPVGAILAVVAWLMVAGRLKSHGLEEFLALLQDLAAADGETAPGKS